VVLRRARLRQCLQKHRQVLDFTRNLDISRISVDNFVDIPSAGLRTPLKTLGFVTLPAKVAMGTWLYKSTAYGALRLF